HRGAREVEVRWGEARVKLPGMAEQRHRLPGATARERQGAEVEVAERLPRVHGERASKLGSGRPRVTQVLERDPPVDVQQGPAGIRRIAHPVGRDGPGPVPRVRGREADLQQYGRIPGLNLEGLAVDGDGVAW